MRSTLSAFVIATGCGTGDSVTSIIESEDLPRMEAEKTPAYLVFNRVQDPNGRTMFASVLPSLTAGTLDLSNAQEFSGISRVRSHEGKLFSFDGETGEAARYVIDESGRVSLDVLENGDDARMSFAQLGVSLFSDNIHFASSTRAFNFATLSADLVIEWNPQTMTITNSFPAGLIRPELSLSGGRITQVGDSVVMPVSWLSFATGDAVLSAAIAVVDLTDASEVTLIEDERCTGTSAAFEHAGNIYALSDNFGGLLDQATPPGLLPPPCLLKYTPGSDKFDEDYYLDLAEVTGRSLIAGGVSNGEGSFVAMAYASDEDYRSLGPFELLDGDYWARIVVNVAAETSAPFGSLSPGPVANAGWVIDGDFLAPSTNTEDGTASMYKMSQSESEELLTVAGEIFHLARIR